MQHCAVAVAGRCGSRIESPSAHSTSLRACAAGCRKHRRGRLVLFCTCRLHVASDGTRTARRLDQRVRRGRLGSSRVRRVALEDLIDAHDVARILGLSHRNTVSLYLRRYPDMPRPVLDLGRGRPSLWLRPEIEGVGMLARRRSGRRVRGVVLLVDGRRARSQGWLLPRMFLMFVRFPRTANHPLPGGSGTGWAVFRRGVPSGAAFGARGASRESLRAVAPVDRPDEAPGTVLGGRTTPTTTAVIAECSSAQSPE